jgi:YVTN family beta-propeller protein
MKILTQVLAAKKLVEIRDPMVVLTFITASFMITIPYQCIAQPEDDSRNYPRDIPHIQVDEWPIAITVDEIRNIVYVVHSIPPHALFAINGSDNTLLSNVLLDDPLYDPDKYSTGGTILQGGIAVNSKKNIVYVSHPDGLIMINGSDYTPLGHISMFPGVLALDETRDRLYVSNRNPTSVWVINGSDPTPLATISVDTMDATYSIPSLSVDTEKNLIYIPNSFSNTVSIVDGNKLGEKGSDIEVRKIIVGKSPGSITLDPTTNMTYVAIGNDDRISTINGNTSEVRTFVLGEASFEPADRSIALNPKTNTVYATNPSANSVSVINASNNELLTDIPVGDSPSAIAVNKNTSSVYIINSKSSTVSAINGTKYGFPQSLLTGDQSDNGIAGIPGIKVESNPRAIAINPKTDMIYVANHFSDTVSVIRGSDNKPVAHVPVNDGPTGIAVDEDRNTIYVTNGTSISIIQGLNNKLQPNVSVDTSNRQKSMVIGERSILYVANPQNDSVTIIDGSNNNNIVGSFPYGDNSSGLDFPSSIDIYESGAELYVTNTDPPSVAVISGEEGTVLNKIPLDDYPYGIAVNPHINMLYVAGSESISVIDPYLDRIVTQIPILAEDIAVNPKTDMVYTTNPVNSIVSVLDGKNNTLTTNITLGISPYAVAVNPDRNLVYVADRESDTVYVIDGKTNKALAGVTFNVSPQNSGRIICSGEEYTTNIYAMVPFSSQCKAEPNRGFVFSSWSENLGPNSSRTVNSSIASDSLSSFFTDLFTNTSDNSSLAVTQYGNFVANFREAPSPIPKEIWLSLFGISLSVIIPSILRWYNGSKQRRKFYEYLQELPSKYDTRTDLKTIDKEITELYAKGKINESQHKMLKDKASEYYKDKTDSLK